MHLDLFLFLPTQHNARLDKTLCDHPTALAAEAVEAQAEAPNIERMALSIWIKFYFCCAQISLRPMHSNN